MSTDALPPASSAPRPANTPGWDPDQIAADIGRLYERSGRGEAWAEEEADVREAIARLAPRLARYDSPTAVGVGGLGIVLGVKDRLLSGQRCAVKFPRPRPGSQELFSEMIAKEIRHLSTIRHAGIVRIHGAGEIEGSPPQTQPVPFYVMDFVEGNSSSSYLSKTSGAPIIDVVRLTANAIAALHGADLVHCDLKPDNIMIASDGRPVITDLGTTKAFQPSDDSSTRIGVTRSYAPRDVIEYLSVVSESDPDNFAGQIPRSHIRKEWDLICFAKTILSWLGYKIETGEPSPLTYAIEPYTRKYLLLMAARMLGAKDGWAWLASEVNLTTGVIEELRYDHIEQVVRDVDKVAGRYELGRHVPELDAYSPDMVQVTGDEPTPLTKRVRALLEHPAMRRLGSITQLGIVNQVYLTATHTRFEHSLGTYGHACRLVRSLYQDPFSPLFRQVMSAEDLSRLLAMSLLHDTGQFPLAHDLEEIDGALFDHKRLTRAVLRGERDLKTRGYQKLALDSIDGALQEWGVTPKEMEQLLDVRLDRYADGVKERILHSVIDGAIDADKLDYLARDSSRLGVPYGAAIDRERIAGSVTAIVTENRNGNVVACIGVHEKARVAAEFLTIARSAMFSQVYWHHTVRAMKAMLTRAVQRIVTHLNGQEERRNRFMSNFEHFVMALPGSLSPRSPQLALPEQETEDAPAGEAAPSVTAENPGTLAATDAAVLIYLEEFMRAEGLPDFELLRAIRARALYKRLYVWSLSGEENTGPDLAATWSGLSPQQKLAVYERLESAAGEAVGVAGEEGAETVTLTTALVERVRLRVEGRQPIFLIDVPGARPGSEIPLYYVREAERRALRKDGSAVGKARESRTWEEYGQNLQAKAGKLRVFCHPDVVDPVEAAFDRDAFVRVFDEACRSATHSD